MLKPRDVDTNKINGPGYYPRRPGQYNVFSFSGAPFQINVLQKDRYAKDLKTAALMSWDHCPWRGSGIYSVQCIYSQSTIGAIEIRDLSSHAIYSHLLTTPVVLKVGERFTFELRNPTSSRRGVSIREQWTVPK